MSTSHRGLPPMSLPVPSPSSNLGQLPDRWQHGNDETQRNWLQAKAEEERRRQEEERRRQEEERTRQENFRLEIRRTELEMLREAFRGGMPPHLVPVIFTGGGALAGTSAEWASHYIAQLNQNNQQAIQGNMISPPDSRIETRLLTASEHQTPQSATMSSATRPPAHVSTPQAHPPPHQTPGSAHGTPSSHPPPPLGYSPFNLGGSPARHHSQQIHHTEPPRSSLPRINTNELHVQPPPPGPPPGLNMQLSGVPSQNSSSVQHISNHHPQPAALPPPPQPEPPRQAESSPIFFHHWQPPATAQSSNSTPVASTSPGSGKNVESPFTHQHYLSGNGAIHSPKKRKTLSGAQFIQHGPVDSSPNHQANSFSPSISSGSSSGGKKRGVQTTHNRNRSDSGPRHYEPYPKNPASRPRREGGSSFNDNNGSTGQFSISHMTIQDESPELVHREHPSSQKHQSEHQSSHPGYSAGPDSRRDQQQSHRERERSISHGPPQRN